MGFNLNKAKAAKEEILQSFTPPELNEGNVSAIFNRCLAKGDDPQGDICASVLFRQASGYDEDSKPVFFSRARIKQNKMMIFYLLGQLQSVHGDVARITSSESVYRYDGVQ